MDINNFFGVWAQNHLEIDFKKPMAVAVSGGPDSMALADMMMKTLGKAETPINFLTVDHGLRDAAKEEAKIVGDWVAAKNNKNFHHKIIEWKGQKPEAALMEAARAARYALMAEYCHQHNIEMLFVAHHQDDQAETFLIRLSKGSGLDGLGAMQDRRDYDDHLKIIRPLLGVSKQDLVQYCDANSVPYVQDPSNENLNFMRPRLRQSMDILAEEGLSAKRLALTAKRLSRAREALLEIADSAYQACLIEKNKNASIFNFSTLQSCPAEIALRVIQNALEESRESTNYGVRMERLEVLFESLWKNPKEFKPRTLGGCKFSLKSDKEIGYLALWIEKEDT